MKKNFTISLIIILGIFIFFSFLEVSIVSAQAGDITPGGPIKLPNPFGDKDIIDLIDIIIGFLVTISIPITVIMVLVGSFLMMSAGGNAEQFRKGNKAIMYALIGFALVLVSRGIITVVKEVISGGGAA